VVELHAHTTASDGDLTPTALVAHAAAATVTVLAITDHDTVAGVAEARDAAAGLGVTVVPGIELTARVPHGSMHLLGYFGSPSPAPLVNQLETLRIGRERRLRLMVDRLGRLGVPVDWDAVRARAAHQLGRPHLADALVAAGHAASREQAFAEWIGFGRPGFIPADGLDPDEAVRLVVASGGVPVLAHPASLALPPRHLESFVQRLAARGLGGIEVHRPDHTPEQRGAYAEIARRRRLLPCGGSDFHRPEGPFALGDSGTPGLSNAVVRELLERIS
jgi:hypothetical protein